MLVDLTDVLDAYELANVIHEAAFKGRFSLPATRDAIARANGRHNLAVLEKALALNAAGSAGFKSRLEKAFFSMLNGLPEPLVNTHVHGVEPDFHWPEFKLAVEIDGPGHGRPRTQREDALKQQILEAAGYTVVALHRRGPRALTAPLPIGCRASRQFALSSPRRTQGVHDEEDQGSRHVCCSHASGFPAGRRPGQGFLDLGLEQTQGNGRGVGVHPRLSACGFSTPLTKRPLEGARRNSSNSISLHG